jgi:hypothetical protein
MAIFNVTIGADTVEVYGGLPALTSYLNTASSDGAVAWRALSASPDDQKRKLVDATRFIDAQIWQGAATALAGGTPTTLQFPRSGLTNIDGTPLDPTNVPQVLINAVFEMTALLADDSSLTGAVDSGSNLESLGAGSAKLQFFQPQSQLIGNATLLPTAVDRLIGRWLAGASAAIAAAVAGVSTGSNCQPCCLICNCSPCCCSSTNIAWPL